MMKGIIKVIYKRIQHGFLIFPYFCFQVSPWGTVGIIGHLFIKLCINTSGFCLNKIYGISKCKNIKNHPHFIINYTNLSHKFSNLVPSIYVKNLLNMQLSLQTNLPLENTNERIFVLLPIRVELFPLLSLSHANKGLAGRISLIKLCLNQIKNQDVLIICSSFISNLSSVFLSELFVISVFILWLIFKGAFRFICILNLYLKRKNKE